MITKINKTSKIREKITRKPVDKDEKIVKKTLDDMIKHISKKSNTKLSIIKEDMDEENECEMDGRLMACKNNKIREKILYQCIKGETVTDSELKQSFKCGPGKMRDMVRKLIEKYPDIPGTIKQIGGQGNNYDYTFIHEGKSMNIELKTNDLSTKYEILEKVPWTGYGQLIQIMLDVKDEKYKPLFQSFDTEGMIEAWFHEVIISVLVPKYEIQGEITYESYYKLLFKTTETASKQYNNESLSLGTRNLFKYFHQHRTKEDNKYRSKLWNDFCSRWMQTHRFDNEFASELLKATLLKKDIWICTTKNDAYIIDGPQCVSMEFKELKKGKDATVLVYKTSLQSKDNIYDIDIEFRIYWKNGGQGVHNLCLQIG